MLKDNEEIVENMQAYYDRSNPCFSFLYLSISYANDKYTGIVCHRAGDGVMDIYPIQCLHLIWPLFTHCLSDVIFILPVCSQKQQLYGGNGDESFSAFLLMECRCEMVLVRVCGSHFFLCTNWQFHIYSCSLGTSLSQARLDKVYFKLKWL